MLTPIAFIAFSGTSHMMLVGSLILGAAASCAAVVILRTLRRMPAQRTQLTAGWLRFDQTHHWDAAAEDWLPNDRRSGL